MVTISTDKSLLDVEMIHRFLSEESYWAKNVPRQRVERAIANSVCFGAFDDGKQVGFARVITDHTAFAYLGDVFVLPSHRGQGISKMLMQAIRAHADLQGLRRWHLVTADAHELYKQFGFRELAKPSRHMEIFAPDVYEK